MSFKEKLTFAFYFFSIIFFSYRTHKQDCLSKLGEYEKEFSTETLPTLFV